MPSHTFEHRNPESLKNHPINATIYGSIPDPEYVASVKEHGVTEPLLITKDNVVISGHRRRQAAIMCGIKEVPVVVLHEVTDPLLIERRLILANRHRDKTTEQRAREFENLKRIEAAIAEQRQKSSLKKGASPVCPNLSTRGKPEEKAKKGRAATIAAEAVGMKTTTAEKAVEVVHAIDEAEAKGETERAEELRQTLNEKSVSAAVAKVNETPTKPADDVVLDGLKRAAPEHIVPVFEAMEEFKTLNRKLGGLKNDIKALCEIPAGVELKAQWQAFEAGIKSAQSVLKFSTPYTECPRCKGNVKDDCDLCRGHGFIVRGQDGRLLDADRAWLGIAK